jgi:hypothetical protein
MICIVGPTGWYMHKTPNPPLLGSTDANVTVTKGMQHDTAFLLLGHVTY